jgi:hypothetical protein
MPDDLDSEFAAAGNAVEEGKKQLTTESRVSKPTTVL